MRLVVAIFIIFIFSKKKKKKIIFILLEERQPLQSPVFATPFVYLSVTD